MRRLLYFLWAGLLAACGEPAATSTQPEPAPPPAGPQQFLVVRTADWETVDGTLYYFDRTATGWESAGTPIPIVVGKNGLAWGRGIADYTGRPGPVKREGDRKSPAGVFRLGEAFGYAPPAQAAFVKAPYTHVTDRTMCIEDVASTSYNRILDEGTVPTDWNSTDRMRRQDDLYEWGMFVEHNVAQVAEGGSCIFLHVWRRAGSGTAGCTAMPKDRLRELLAWIDPAAEPHLVQVPATAYASFQAEYDLPALP